MNYTKYENQLERSTGRYTTDPSLDETLEKFSHHQGVNEKQD